MNWLILLFLTLFSLVFITSNSISFAQTSAISPFITWQTDTYTPPSYGGKTLPSYGANITASLAAISHGTAISFANRTVNWYANSSFLGGGIGKTQISFPMQISPGSGLGLEARIANYPSGSLVASIFLPVVTPRLVIRAPYPHHTFSGGELDLVAIPYFFTRFTASSANITWNVNGQTAQGEKNNPFLFRYQAVSTGTVNVAVNMETGTESASANMFFIPQ